MDKRTIVITGASDGIGAQAARTLHSMGHDVIVVGRSPQKTKLVADELNVPSYVADFAVLDDVRQLAHDLRRDVATIDVLANNAGGIFGERELTIDGHEKTMQVNHLAPFLLTHLLMDRLIDSKAAILNTSSVAHRIFSKFDVHDLEVTKNYSQRIAYGNAKLENVLFTFELHKRYHDQGISTAAFHPGGVATNFASETNSLMRYVYGTPLRKLFLISVEKGSDNLIWLASTNPGKDWQSGAYYVKRSLSSALDKEAINPENARLLWEQSMAFIEA